MQLTGSERSRSLKAEAFREPCATQALPGRAAEQTAHMPAESSTPRAVPESIRTRIHSIYRKLLGPNGERRAGQCQIIGAVANAVANAKHQDNDAPAGGAHLLAAQAPTGTGKTYAYTVGAVPMALSMGLKVIVSTGTVQLQEQLVLQDMPRVAEAIPEMRVALVKGRGRYACPIRMREVSAGDDAEAGAAAALLTNLESGAWSGDLDDLPEQPERHLWSRMTNDRNGCPGRQCSQYSQCPFSRARANAKDANVLIVNHDLLLSDIQCGNNILPKLKDCVVLVDEAHELPEKALGTIAAKTSAEAGLHQVNRAQRAVGHVMTASRDPELRGLCAEAQEHLMALTGTIHECHEALEANGCLNQDRDPKRAFRFSMGKLPERLERAAAYCQGSGEASVTAIEALRDYLTGEESPLSAEQGTKLLSELGRAIGPLAEMVRCWTLMATQQIGDAPVAKWIEVDPHHPGEFLVCASPLVAGQFLDEMLWKVCAASVHVSATLEALGGLDPYMKDSGLALTPGARSMCVASPFDLRTQARVEVPSWVRNPKLDPEGHAADVLQLTQTEIQSLPGGEGMLVLFSSWAMLNATAAGLPEEMRAKVLLQGSMSKRELLIQHKARVDAGEPSVLFGTASLEQGVDLPGRYLTKLLIAKLQFEVPTDPVVDQHSEYLNTMGRNYFDEIALCLVFRRLVQSLGRLIRTATDSGKAIIADVRLTGTKWGKRLVAALHEYAISSDGKPAETKAKAKRAAQPSARQSQTESAPSYSPAGGLQPIPW